MYVRRYRIALFGLCVVPFLVSCGRTADSAIDVGSLVLHSPAFAQGESIPREFTCDGRGVNPPLVIEGVPQKATRLALVLDDPDAPIGVWTHWVVWNIPVSVATIESGTPPETATEGKTSAGKPGYNPPCPPSGTHHYRFKLFALSRPVTLPSSATADELVRAFSGSILDTTVLTGTYSHKN